MIYTPQIEKAIRFAIKVHQQDQDQRRKVSKVPYIIHPLSVALVLSQAGANEETIIAGILHDTVEDCNKNCPVTIDDIAREFNKNIARMVDDVTEPKDEKNWQRRKDIALEKVLNGSQNSQLIKTADLICNISDLVFDYQFTGEKMFQKFFTGDKKHYLEMYQQRYEALKKSWPGNYLLDDLKSKLEELAR